MALKFEHRHQPLAPRDKFVRRLLNAALLAVAALIVWMIVGVCGYHWIAGLPWVDAFLNASMIVGGMGPVDLLNSDSAKIFAGFYAIFSGVIFLAIFGLLIAPIFHRFLHRFHLEAKSE
ncbi:MAG: hypothetical protein IPH75_10160 [bacterium]|nr:hypothetical protein [bacterium]